MKNDSFSLELVGKKKKLCVPINSCKCRISWFKTGAIVYGIIWNRENFKLEKGKACSAGAVTLFEF